MIAVETVFRSQGVHRDALAAWIVLREAVERKSCTTLSSSTPHGCSSVSAVDAETLDRRRGSDRCRSLLLRPCVLASSCALWAGLTIQARSAAPAAAIAPRPVLEQSIERSAAIFFGLAVRIEWTGVDPEPGAGLPNRKAVTFEVERQWKGAPDRTITIHTGSGGGDCGSPFDVGLTYLVYAHPERRFRLDAADFDLSSRSGGRREIPAHGRTGSTRLDQLVLDRGARPETARHHDEIRRSSHDAYRIAAMRLRRRNGGGRGRLPVRRHRRSLREAP